MGVTEFGFHVNAVTQGRQFGADGLWYAALGRDPVRFYEALMRGAAMACWMSMSKSMTFISICGVVCGMR